MGNSKSKNKLSSEKQKAKNKINSTDVGGYVLIEFISWIFVILLLFIFLISTHQKIEKANISLLKKATSTWNELEREYAEKN